VTKPILRRLVSGAVTIAVGAALVTTAVPAFADSSSPAAATPAAGVYRGAGGNGSTKIAAYKAFTKTSVPFALDFQATDTLDNLAFPSWMSDAWKSSGETMILGSTLALPGDWNRSFQGETWSWSDAASGALDATWKLEGQRLVAAGQADAVLRGNHEFNGSWFSWQVKNGEQAAFIQAWQRWVTVLRAVPGQRFGFDWNPTVGQMSLADPESAYPGDAYVTRIALDVYDGYYGPGFVPGQAQPSDAARAAVWDTLLNGPRGLVFWKNFANAHAKHMSFPEWGLENWADSDGKVHGGGDDAAFIQHMAAIFTDPSYHVDYQAFWEDPADGGRGVSDPDSGRAVPVPNSRAAYLKYIAVSSPASPVTTPAPTTPIPTPTPVATVTPTATPSAVASTTPAAAPSSTVTATSTPTQVPLASQPMTSPLPACMPTVAAPANTTSVSASTLLGYSPWSDRSWTSPLAGKTITGNLFAYITSGAIKSVAFYVDDPTRSMAPVNVDSAAPFDVTASSAWWSNGLHTITFVITGTTGGISIGNTQFRVAN
jgi:hypothetical protein